MAVESKEWVIANYRKQDVKSGIHIYIDYETLKFALENTNLKLGEPLEIKRFPLKGNGDNAKVLIQIRLNKYPHANASNKLNSYCKTHPHFKPRYCQVEGCMDDAPQWHHEDYSKPLDVIWLCSEHHSRYANGERFKMKKRKVKQWYGIYVKYVDINF